MKIVVKSRLIWRLRYNGCGYEIGWECEELTYQTAPNLQRATQLNNLLKPNCFIPVVICCFLISYNLSTEWVRSAEW